MLYISEFLTVPVYSRLCRVPKRRNSCAWCSQCYRLYVPSVIQPTALNNCIHRPGSRSRFSSTPADSVVKPTKKLTSHRQPKDPSATGIALQWKYKQAASCRNIGSKCFVELMRRGIQVAYIHSQTINSIIHCVFAIFVPQVPVASEACKKVVKGQLKPIVKPADFSWISPANQPPVF